MMLIIFNKVVLIIKQILLYNLQHIDILMLFIVAIVYTYYEDLQYSPILHHSPLADIRAVYENTSRRYHPSKFESAGVTKVKVNL